MISINISSRTKINLPDAQFEAKCLELTHTHSLHWLQAWCTEHQISQSTWKRLYVNLRFYIESNGQYRAQSQVLCCIRESVLEREARSIDICDRLGWVLKETSGGYEIYQGEQLVDNVFALSIGYRTKNSPPCGAADPYTAALNRLTPRILQDLALAIHRDRLEINLANTSAATNLHGYCGSVCTKLFCLKRLI
jgi:hypothetical protein